VDSTDGSWPQSMQSAQYEDQLSRPESHGKYWPFLQVIVFPGINFDSKLQSLDSDSGVILIPIGQTYQL
jgi:hypothetical protein